MRTIHHWLLPAFLCLQSISSLAQSPSTVQAQPHLAARDTSLIRHINQLIAQETGLQANIHWQADSISTSHQLLEIYFNTDSTFNTGGLTETETEGLTELLAHLTTETNTRSISLLAREKSTGHWKTLDYFVYQPALARYVLPVNQDPYPAMKGKTGNAQQRVFPGGGMPGVTGALTGKTVWLSPGHGWQNNTGNGFLTQRSTTNQVVEDFITAETVDYYLLNYLINAGANVWSVRERDVNTNEIIVNNDQGAPGYTETGTWADGSIAGYGGTYRTNTASATETATATFTPVVNTSGLYWVSVRFISGTNRATDVRFTVSHAGGDAVYTLNQEIHGDTWVYLGQFYFFAGGSYKVSISNQSADIGQAIVADAVRLGGGVGTLADCVQGGSPSGRPRFEEAARQYARYQGNPSCREDVTVRPTYAEYELSKGASSEMANAIYVAVHTNAGGGTGTETFRYNGAGSSQPTITPGSTELRDSIHKQIIADIRAGWKSTWADRGVKEDNFGELRELHNIPGILIELAFHDLAADATDLKAPEFRRLAARAIYKGILKFYHYRDGIPVNFLPEQPTQLSAKNIGSAQITLHWMAPVTGGIYGDPATSYRVYISENGRGFGNPVEVTNTTYTLSGVAGKTYFFKVTAVNAGGESFASGLVAARTATGTGTEKFLVVDGFDRLDASAMLLKNESAALGNVRRMELDKMNNYSYMVEHGNGLGSCNIAFDGVQNETVIAGDINLADYTAIDWYLGEESTADKTLDATERQLLKNYLDAGGRLLISGAEIGWDIGRTASANADLAFYNNYLKAVYVADGAGTYNFSGTTALVNGSTGTFSNGTNGYNVDFPDVININGGSQIVLNYSGGTGAGVGYKGSFRVLYFGFPVEAIMDENTRNSLICQSMDYLRAAATLPVRGFTLSGLASEGMNKLQWVTLSAINTTHFVVERSTDGIHFSTLGNTVYARENAIEENSYHFNDTDPQPLSWYRIRAIDQDGQETISNMVLIKNSQRRPFYVLENPAVNSIRLQVTNPMAFSLVLTNAQAQVVYRMQHPAIANGQVTIPAGQLASGVYWLTMHTQGGQPQTVKIIVK